jgi:hypothetical protein
VLAYRPPSAAVGVGISVVAALSGLALALGGRA